MEDEAAAVASRNFFEVKDHSCDFETGSW